MNDIDQWREASRRFSEIRREIHTLWKRRMAQKPDRDSPAFVSKLNALHAEQRELWTSERRRAREKYVLKMRAAGKTLREIASELGITTERARQIHVGAERKSFK
jgi:DNA-directed RNA polymerase sigma subunit (sigma70/sigma32)